MIDPNSIDLAALPSLLLSDRRKFPEESCIYFAIDSGGVIKYIGQTSNLKQRWRSHQKYRQLMEFEGVRIAYMSCPKEFARQIESALIQWFSPQLNNFDIPLSDDKGVEVVRQTKTLVPKLPEMIRAARLKDGRSCQLLATLAGVSMPYWYELERGIHQRISEEVLKRIEKALGVDFGVKFDK